MGPRQMSKATPVHFSIQTRSRSRLGSESPTRSSSPEECGQQVDLEAIAEELDGIAQAVRVDEPNIEEREIAAIIEEANYAEEMAEARGPLIIPGKFKGGFDDNVESYLAQFERVSKANGWNDQKKLVVIPCYLEGAALKWYENMEARLGEDITWEQLRNCMKEAFQSIAWDEQLEYRLRMRMQADDEPVESYFQDVINLCAKVDPDMAERSKIKHVLRGLAPSLLEKVMVLDNDTLESLLRNIRRIQTARYMAGHRVDQVLGVTSRDMPSTSVTRSIGASRDPSSRLESQVETLASEFSKLRVRLLEGNLKPTSQSTDDKDTSTAGQPRDRLYHPRGSRPPGTRRGRGGRTSDGRVICYRCNRVGHYAVNCRSGDQNQGNERGER